MPSLSPPLSPLELPLSFAMTLKGLAATNTANAMVASEASKTITNRLRLFSDSTSPRYRTINLTWKSKSIRFIKSAS
ncbi:MAG: hypothetical protein WA395_03375 [Nitrososphaeraceae archaeon]